MQVSFIAGLTEKPFTNLNKLLTNNPQDQEREIP